MKGVRSEWIVAGRPRDGPFFQRYKQFKRQFRCELRRAFRDYERSEYERIDNLAEMDHNVFWKVINARKRKRKNNFSEIRFNDKLLREPDQLLSGWQDYFEDLYSFTKDNEFDSEFKSKVDSAVIEYLRSEDSWPSSNIVVQVDEKELIDIVKTLPNG